MDALRLALLLKSTPSADSSYTSTSVENSLEAFTEFFAAPLFDGTGFATAGPDAACFLSDISDGGIITGSLETEDVSGSALKVFS